MSSRAVKSALDLLAAGRAANDALDALQAVMPDVYFTPFLKRLLVGVICELPKGKQEAFRKQIQEAMLPMPCFRLPD